MLIMPEAKTSRGPTFDITGAGGFIAGVRVDGWVGLVPRSARRREEKRVTVLTQRHPRLKQTHDRQSGTQNGLHHAAMKAGESKECGECGGWVDGKHGHGANGFKG